VADDELMTTALQVAEKLAASSSSAMAATKRSLNHWVRAAGPIFESALGLEMLGFFSPDAREGLNAMKEKRPPQFGAAGGIQ
jgi:enoyl-CoA hydratase